MALAAHNFSSNLVRLQGERGFKWVWLARRIGVTPKTIHFWISDAMHPSLESFAAVANTLNVEPSELLK